MLDTDEVAFLRSIAEEHNENAARLVYADWLEERGESPRAEFVRVQCELAVPGIPEKRRHAFRVRERKLLDGHRQEWCRAFGLPIEDVCFERGVIDKVRLSRWDHGKLLDPAYAQQFATLTELDLSGLQLGDDGLTAFAATARLPALRKLILNDNGISNVGAIALSSATGLPRLDTVYLFQNAISEGARASLERGSRFRSTTLDLGERAEGYCMSRGEVDMARRQYLREHLLPLVSKNFKTYKRLQSAMLCVAQYWADEADDAVHGTLIVSELFEPTMEGVNWGGDESSVDPNVLNTRIKNKYGDGSSSAIGFWGSHWDDNSRAIPLWAAFAPEEGHQEYEYLKEVYSPAVMFCRHGGYEILPMLRPHLDGVRPEWGWED